MDQPSRIKTKFPAAPIKIPFLLDILPHFGLPDSFPFGEAWGSRGQKALLCEEELKAHDIAPAPRPPPIQEYLALAYRLKGRLDVDSELTHGALAREIGFNRYEILRTLKLLKLAPQIQHFIRSLPPTSIRRFPLSKRNLHSVLQFKDHNQQTREFNRLIAPTPLASTWESSLTTETTNG